MDSARAGNYYEKYQKYKIKYLAKKKDWKGQYGGNNQEQQIPDVKFAIDEIYFWGRQFADHAHIYSLALEKPVTLKAQAAEAHQKWEEYMNKEFYSKGIVKEEYDPQNPKKVKILLDENDFAKLDIQQFDFATMFKLLAELKASKQMVLAAIKDKKDWLGWVYPSLAQHVLEELEMFEKRIQGQLTPEQDIAFYVKMCKDHIAVSEKLVDPDPQNDPLSAMMKAIVKKAPLGTNNANQAMAYIQEVDKAGHDTQQQIHFKKLLCIIPPELIDHDVREHNYALARLGQIKSTMQ
jgi:hypothetical protein